MRGTRSIQALSVGVMISIGASSLAAPPAALPAAPSVPPFAERCANAGERGQNPQGPALWGQRPAGTSADLMTRPLVQQVEMTSVSSDRGPAAALRLQGGRLAMGAQASGPAAAGSTDPLVGAVLTGIAPDGTRVPLAICAARPSLDDPGTRLYNVQYFNKAKLAWQNICEGQVVEKDDRTPSGTERPPLALAVSGRWRPDGAREEVPGAFTLACETGAIGKCASWGYVPGQSQDGRALTDYHAACTRMARADYCGNGRAHTTAGVVIDLYDDLGIQKPARRPGTLFEAAWSPDGAFCLSRTRKGIPLETIRKECPERFAKNTRTDLGDGDSCTLNPKTKSATRPLLRNGFRK